MSDIVKSVALYSDHAGSDKVYNVQIVKDGEEYRVNYQNGRRGGTLASDTKTKSPVSLEKASQIFDKLVKEKKNGSSHYREVDADENAYVAPVEKESAGFQPMLLTPVSEDSLTDFISSGNHVMQQKHDGERLAVFVSKAGVIGVNKTGYRRGVPRAVENELSKLGVCDLDGELVGDILHVFDIMSRGGKSLMDRPYEKRLAALGEIVSEDGGAVRLVKTFAGEEKRKAFSSARKAKWEGVVFKRVDANYEECRTDSVLKYKFTESASLVVVARNQSKSSVKVGFYVDGEVVPTCNLTIPKNVTFPSEGDIVEVEYLYAYPGTNALAQGTFKALRTDQRVEDCLLSQLKYKSSASDDDVDNVEIEPEKKTPKVRRTR